MGIPNNLEFLDKMHLLIGVYMNGKFFPESKYDVAVID